MTTHAQPNPESLVTRILDNDHSAEDELVSFYLPTVRFILSSRYQDRELVKDVLQETFIAVIQNLRAGKLKNPAALSGYIRSITLHKASELLRKESRSLATNPAVLDMLSSGEDLSSTVERNELAKLVRQAVDSLDQVRDRELILQFYYQDVDKQRLCEQFGITTAHFDRVNYRARKRLMVMFEKILKSRRPIRKVVPSHLPPHDNGDDHD